MFDLYGNDKLIEWKKFRDRLETSENPFEDVLELWKQAPFVNSYLDNNYPNEWPDPWHLILDGKYDDLAICLGIVYTLKLTQRFMSSTFEIHTSIKDNRKYYILVDQKQVFDIEFRNLLDIKDLDLENISLIKTIKDIK